MTNTYAAASFRFRSGNSFRDKLEDPATEYSGCKTFTSEHTDHTPTDGSVRDDEKLMKQMLTIKRSPEYGSLIIHSHVTGEPRVVYGNVMNTGLIDNLPECCVEVPCVVDKNGVQPTHVSARCPRNSPP